MFTLGVISTDELVRLKTGGRSLVGISMGDPAGIGPEIIIDAIPRLTAPKIFPVVFGSFSAFYGALDAGRTQPEREFREVRFNVGEPLPGIDRRESRPLRDYDSPDAIFVDIDSAVPENRLSGKSGGAIIPGESNGLCGRIAFESFKSAVIAAEKGLTACLVTAPLSKKSVSEGIGARFLGHTGWLTGYFRKKENETGMLFHTGDIAVSLVTVHEPVARLHGLLTRERVRDMILLTRDTLREHFGKKTPRLCVLGFNPHAGEGGYIGDEEDTIILPAINDAASLGVTATGPIPADTAFRQNVLSAFDAVVAMYHDQALGPLKALYPCGSVNFTMGLPVIRTSPDHGTAFDIAGQGLADSSGIAAAIDLAATLSAGE